MKSLFVGLLVFVSCSFASAQSVPFQAPPFASGPSAFGSGFAVARCATVAIGLRSAPHVYCEIHLAAADA